MSEPQPIGTCVIITNARNQILLGKRKNSYKAGLYGLPGGRTELNELLLSAITRETTEETGIKDLKFTFVGVVRENQGAYDFIHFVFSAQAVDQEPTLCEPDKCEGWEWLDLSTDLPEVLPGHRAALELYETGRYLADIVQSS